MPYSNGLVTFLKSKTAAQCRIFKNYFVMVKLQNLMVSEEHLSFKSLALLLLLVPIFFSLLVTFIDFIDFISR